MTTRQVLVRGSKSARYVYSPSCPVDAIHRNKRVFKDLCVFCNTWESLNAKVWIIERFAVGHCTASHCRSLYKETTLKWPKSEFALIYRDGVGGKYDGRRARGGLQEEKGSAAPPSLLSALLLLPVIKVLFFSFFYLDCGSRCRFCWSITAHNRSSLQMCGNAAFACVCMYCC